jgi:MFS family permease
MEAYCVFLMGSFVAMDEFKDKFGVLDKDGKMSILASWQSALQVGGPLGAIIGVMLAGPLTSRIGYRWATITGLMLLNAFIFIFYFANSLAVMFVSQLLEGIPWGIFIANAPAYCSEIVPIALRAPATQMLQMFWAIGAIIVGGVCYVYQGKHDASAYRFGSPFPTCSRFHRVVLAAHWQNSYSRITNARISRFRLFAHYMDISALVMPIRQRQYYNFERYNSTSPQQRK